MPSSRDSLYRRHRFPPEVISYAVWLNFRFPLSLRMIEEMLAARGICVTHETVRQWETPTSGAGLIWTVFDEFEAAVERRV